MQPPSNPVIRTERLILRPGVETDVPAIVRFFIENREHLVPWEPDRPAEFYTEDFWRVQVQRHRAAFQNGSALMLFMFVREDPNRPIGQISFTNISRGPAEACNCGYALAATAQGNGYMTEALAAAIDYVFKRLNLHRVQAAFMPNNERSNAVLRRCGFVVEGYARDYLMIGGRWRDHVLTAIINPEWVAPERSR